MKEKFSLYFVATLKRIGALWVGFLFSLIPLNILRANISDVSGRADAEALISFLVVVCISSVFLFLLYRRDDAVAKMDNKSIVELTVAPTIVHFFLCVLICWSKYVYFLLSGAYSIAQLFAPGASDINEQAIWSVLLAALIVTPIPAVGVFFGCLSARKKRKKEIEELYRASNLR